ncbi:MAG: cadherin-like domain-containing protein, partial [Syntrophomonadaceae bacterium]|nr:cadherin-like domain-containing protein [Syntrophomonadaceae bacterium]
MKKKKLLALFLVVYFVLFTGLSGFKTDPVCADTLDQPALEEIAAADDISGNDGGEITADPCLIFTGEELIQLAASINNGTTTAGQFYVVAENIDMEGAVWTPIGITDEAAFKGHFDFNGKVISNYILDPDLSIASESVEISNISSEYGGLFGLISSEATITGYVTPPAADVGEDEAADIDEDEAADELDKAITGFYFAGLDPAVSGMIDEETKTITLTVPYGTDLTALVPTIDHNGVSVSPVSGEAADFTDPVIYRVTAEDGSTQDYLVTITVAEQLPEPGLEENNKPFEVVLSGIDLPSAGSGKALNFDGINDYIAIPYSTSTRLAGNMDFTISMWFLPSENKSMNLFQQNANKNQQEAFLRIIDGKICTGLSKQSVQWQRDYGEIPVQFGQWNHVAMIKEGSNLKTYVNGVKDIDVTIGANQMSAAQPTREASFGASSTYFFDGCLDEIQFWNTALSAAAINQWMYSDIDASHPNYNNLALYYKLNEGTGSSSVFDEKGLYNGTMTNMSESAWVDSDIKEWITDEDTPISGCLFGPCGLTYEIADQGAKGNAVISTGNQFTYTPDPDENGSDAFTYRVRDAEGNYSDLQSVSIMINPVDEPPVAGSGSALDFSADRRVNIPYNNSTKLAGNSDFTVSMWIFPEAETGCKTLYRQQGNAKGTLGVWLRYEYDSSDNGYLYYGFNKLGTDGWQWSWQWDQKPASVTTFPLNQWTHVAFTKSGSSVKTYVNGIEYHGITLDPIRLGTPASLDGLINVGGDPYEGNYFDGRIDEVQFWNTALSQNEISDWMYSEVDDKHLKYNNLVYYYKLNEGTGTSTVSDANGMYNGTMVNMSEAAWVDSDIKGWITDEDTPVSGYLFGTYPSGYVYELVSNGLKGTAVITGANQFTYTPAANENGSDTFTYKVRDAEGNYSNTQSVNITIDPVNDPPGQPGPFVSPAAGQSVPPGGSVSVSWGAAADIDNDPLTYTVDFYNGSSWIGNVYSGTGTSFTYTIPAGINTSKAKFRVKASDAASSSIYRESSEFATAQYTLKYAAGSGGSITGNTAQTVSYGGSGTEVSAVADQGYHFVQWSDGKTNAARTDTNVTGNINVTAIFAINQYTVTFKNWNGTVLKTETVNHGSAATAPQVPERDGYTFTGWDRSFSNVTSDITVTAVFEIKNYNVIYHANGATSGTVPASSSHQYMSTVTVAANSGNLAKAGYSFAGWNTKADGTGTNYAAGTGTFTMGASGVNLYARWTANTDTPYTVNHYQQNIEDDGYTLKDTDNLTGTTDTTADAIAKNYTGF